MTTIDADSLEQLRDALQKRLDYADRQRRNEPLHEALQLRLHALMTDVSPNFMADSIAESRKSILAMERSQNASPSRIEEMDARLQSELQRVRARTERLRAWLGALS